MIKIRCVIDHITYQNQENGYSVMRVKVKDYKDPVTLVGNLLDVPVGAVLLCEGDWKMDNRCKELEAREKDLMKQMAVLVEMPLASAALRFILPAFKALCLETPEIHEHLADTIFEDIDEDDFEGIMKTAAEVFIAGILGPQHPVQVSGGGGGSESKLPWKDKDEDLRDYALRCLKFGRKLYKSAKKTKKSSGYHAHR